MTKDSIQQYTYRISKANKTAMVGIIYDITLEYMNEFKECLDEDKARSLLACIKNCLDELKASVIVNNDISYQLLSIYGYVNKLLARIEVSGNRDYILDCIKIISAMNDNWKQVTANDSSDAVMENTENVYSGYTYGKNDVNDNPVALNNRGFLV